jgi:hypothetical protein
VYAAGPLKPGRSLLSEPSARSQGVQPEQLAQWVRSLCDALGALHRHEMVHGNLSPGMFRLLDSGELQLPIVGALLQMDDATAWAAPEQHPLNPKPVGVGAWTDVYQLSALIHQLLTGQSPPSAMRRWEGAPLERLAELGEAYPAELLVATHKGLSMLPSARPQGCLQWLELAGLPDRRVQPRLDSGSFEPGHRHFERGDGQASASADGAGHQPLPVQLQERLDRLDSHARGTRSSMGWLWAFLGLAVVGLLGVVLFT